MPDIIADDGDDREPDATDVLDPEGENDEPDDDDIQPDLSARRRRPSYQDLQAEVEKLRSATRRNNRELAERRRVEKWMESHGIEDFDAWLAEQNIDSNTGQRVAAAEPAPADQPAASNGNVDRLVQLEIEKAQARWDDERAGLEERHTSLTGAVRRLAVEAELAKSQFSGTLDKALRLVEMDRVQIGEDGNITGADEAVASLRTEIPEWFRRNGAGRTRTGGEDVDGGRRPQRPPAKLTWEQKTLNQMIPGAGGR